MKENNIKNNKKAGQNAVARGAINDSVYLELRRSIMTGAFTPGEKVSLRSLADQVGTSITPVRGAVSRLVAEGAFDTLPNRWLVIPPMTASKFEEIVYWRGKLETEAARKATRNFNDKLIDDIELINQEMSKVAEFDNDRRQLLEYNYKFHFVIYEQSKSAILMPMIESLWLQAGPFTYYSLLSPKDLWDAKFHSAIIEGLRNKDEDAVAQAILQDIENTAQFLKSAGEFKPNRLRRVVP